MIFSLVVKSHFVHIKWLLSSRVLVIATMHQHWRWLGLVVNATKRDWILDISGE